MKKLYLVLVFFATIISAVSVEAQSHDASVWMMSNGDETRLIPWYTYNNGSFVDLRYNFDAENSLSFLVGRSIGSGSISLTPAAGFIIGDYNAFSAESYIYAEKGDVSVLMLNQYSHDLDGEADFGYHWVDLRVSVQPWLSVGVDEQVFYDSPTSEAYVDVGPVVELSYKSSYVKVWPAWGINYDAEMLFIGVGIRK